MATTTFILGIIWGFVIYHIALTIKEKNKNKKIVNEISSKFKEVLSNLKNRKASFVSRVNQTVIIDTKVNSLEKVNIVYLMDKGIVCIFKNNECLYTTDSVDVSLKSELVLEINSKFNREINDVVDIMGMTISKEEFKLKMKEIQKFTSNQFNFEDLTKIVHEEEVEEAISFNVDEILDKISKNGIESLSKEEIDFLNNHSKNI